MKHPALYLCLTATLLVAQAAAPEVEITAEPHHHLTFENKSVRVFYVEVPTQTETLMHWHRHDYIYVTLGDAEIANQVKDKPPVTVSLKNGQTAFTPATFAHIARDLSDQPFRNVTIEILDDDALRKSAAHWDEDRGLNIFSGGTQQILFVKDAIRVSEFELQPGATVVPTRHRASPHLLIAVSDLDIPSAVQSDVAGGTQDPTPAHFKSGETRWLPANYSHSITNMGTKPAKFVTLEFP